MPRTRHFVPNQVFFEYVVVKGHQRRSRGNAEKERQSRQCELRELIMVIGAEATQAMHLRPSARPAKLHSLWDLHKIQLFHNSRALLE